MTAVYCPRCRQPVYGSFPVSALESHLRHACPVALADPPTADPPGPDWFERMLSAAERMDAALLACWQLPGVLFILGAPAVVGEIRWWWAVGCALFVVVAFRAGSRPELSGRWVA